MLLNFILSTVRKSLNDKNVMQLKKINKKPLVLLVLLTFILAACYYQSKVPIDKPGLARDKSLIGKWKTSKNSKEYYDILTSKGKYEYVVNHYKYNSKKKKTEKKTGYIAHLSKIGGNTFLNMKKVWTAGYKGKGRPVSAKNQKYMFYKIKKKADGFKADIVTANIREKFTSSNKLKAFFKKHMHLSFFYNKQTVNFMKAGQTGTSVKKVKTSSKPIKTKKKKKWKFKFK